MKGIDAMKKHLGQNSVIKIQKGNDVDEIEIAPLDIEYLPEYWSLFDFLSEIGSKGKVKPEDTLKLLTSKEKSKTLVELIKISIKKANPDVDDSILSKFISKNLLKILPVFFEINTPEV